MICPFCDKKDDFESEKSKQSIYSVCDKCKTLFKFSEDHSGNIESITLSIDYKGLIYYITISYLMEKTSIHAPTNPNFHRKLNETDPNHTCCWRSIKTFPQILNITPSNAAEKLQTILNYL